MYRPTQSPHRARAGAAVVEFAVVAPLLFLLVLGIIEFGRTLMVQEILTNAAREGARRAVLPGATRAEVEKLVQDYLDANLISGHSVQTTDPATAQAGTPVTVTVTVPYAQVSWLPAEAVQWMKGKILTATAVMRKEKQNN